MLSARTRRFIAGHGAIRDNALRLNPFVCELAEGSVTVARRRTTDRTTREVERLAFNARVAARQWEADRAGEDVHIADYDENMVSMRGQSNPPWIEPAQRIIRRSMPVLGFLLLLGIGAIAAYAVAKPRCTPPACQTIAIDPPH